MEDRKQWFIDRIGKVVYANSICTCDYCKLWYDSGVEIFDKDAAINLYDFEVLYQNEGKRLKYFDTKEERTIYEIENGL